MPLDMSQYDLLFGTTRIPGLSKDILRYGANESQPAHHAIVAFRNRVNDRNSTRFFLSNFDYFFFLRKFSFSNYRYSTMKVAL